MEIKEYLENHYINHEEDGRLLSKHGSVEFLTTIKYIEKYLKKDMRILEIGAGTGRYSLYFAEQGYRVDAVELVSHNLDILKGKVKGSYNINALLGNALDLSMYEEETFDITLVLGPLYHLFTEEDKRKAILEALRVTKKNGTIFIAYLTNDSIIINWGLLAGHLADGRKTGIVNKDFRCKSSPEMIFEMFYVKDFDELMGSFDTRHLHTVATDGMSHHFRDKIDAMDEEFFNTWLDYHYSTCERPDLMGYSNHVLYIGEKI